MFSRSNAILRSRGLRLWQGCESEIGLDDAEIWEQLLCLVVVHRWMDNDIVAWRPSQKTVCQDVGFCFTWNPVDRSRNFVTISCLQRIDDSQHLGSVPARARRIRENGSDGLLWVNDEDGADRKSYALLVDIGGVLMVKPGLGKVRIDACL